MKQTNVRIFASHVNTHKIVFSVEEDFNDPGVGRPILWLPVSPFSQALLSSSNGLINQVAMEAGTEVCLGSAIWTSTHQCWPGYSHCRVINLSTSDTKMKSPIWHHSLGWLVSYLVAGWLYWITSSWNGQSFVLIGIDTYSSNGFAFGAHSTSAKTTSVDLENALSTTMHCNKRCFQSRN